MALATAKAPVLPAGRPIREGQNRSTRADADYQLHRAATYLRAGGSREAVEPFIDEWLDYQAELELRQRVGL